VRKVNQHLNNRALLALGEAIRNRRVDLLLSQEQVAAGAQLHRTYVTDVENGLRNLSFLTLLRFAEALNCTLSKIMIETESIDSFEHKAHDQD
jgi:transcriptional regulator with XRE-family HTH domain